MQVPARHPERPAPSLGVPSPILETEPRFSCMHCKLFTTELRSQIAFRFETGSP